MKAERGVGSHDPPQGPSLVRHANMRAIPADEMVAAAMAGCAETTFAGDARRMRLALLRAECQHCRCLSDHLAHHVANWLKHEVPSLKGIYRLQLPAGQPASEAELDRRASELHLAAWVDAKTETLNQLANALDTELAARRRALGCPKARDDCFVLDLQFVDDRDIRQHQGDSGWFSQTDKPETLWERPLDWPETGPEPPAAETEAMVPLSFDPDLVPVRRLIDHALAIERRPPSERAPLEHHLTELKVTLIRRLISDHLDYINVAQRWLTVEDLADIQRHRMGFGRIGGKSAGMLLAGRILLQTGDEALAQSVRVPESYFLGSDLMYVFMAMNGLTHWNDQKYKSEA